jgi:hypothetical protein
MWNDTENKEAFKDEEVAWCLINQI